MEVLETRIRPKADTPKETPDTPPQPQSLGEIRFNSPGYDYGTMDGGTQQAIDLLTMPHKSP